MFDNISQKLKISAKILLGLGIIASAIGLLVSIVNISDTDSIIGVIGSIALFAISIISAWVCYGVGESIENCSESLEKTEKIEKMILNINTNDKLQSDNNEIRFADKKIMSTEKKEEIHKWLCPGCNKMISKNPCPLCGYDNK